MLFNLNSQDRSNVVFDQQNKRIMTVLHTQKKNKHQNKNKSEMVLTRKTKKKSTYWIGLGVGGTLTFHFLTVGFLRKLSDVESTPKNIFFFLFC